MDNKELVIFNKEGYRINTNIDGDGLMYSSLYFDKNSTDTYKTQALYLFNNIPGTNEIYNNVDLEKYQIFNSGGIYCYPTTQQEFDVVNITNTLDSVLYSTKWIYIDNIHNTASVGMYFSFIWDSLGSINPAINEYDLNGVINVFQIKKVEKNRIMIYTDGFNNNPLNIYNYLNNAKIKLHNVIEVNGKFDDQNIVSPTYYNMVPTVVQKQRFSLISNDNNEGTYTTKYETPTRYKKEFYITKDFFQPILPLPPISITSMDSIIIDIIFKNDNLIISNGNTFFHNIGNYIDIGYVPSFLKIGDNITVFSNTTNSLLGFNDDTLTILSIDKTLNRIYIDTNVILTDEINNCKIVLTTNKLSIEKNFLYAPDGVTLSTGVTFNSIASDYTDLLYDTDGDIIIEFIESTNELKITSEFIDEFYDVELYLNRFLGSKQLIPQSTTVGDPFYTKQVESYPIIVDEPLIEYSYIKPNSECYYRELNITDIGGFIVININGKKYLQEFDTDITTTLSNWVTSYSSELSNIFVLVNAIGNTLRIEGMFPNVDVYTDIVNAVYENVYTKFEIQHIKNILIITINGIEFKVDFDTDDATTLNNWVVAHKYNLETRGVIVYVNPLYPNTLSINTILVDSNLDIKFNLGYVKKPGDDSVVEFPVYNDPSFDVISGNKIKSLNYTFTDIFSIGQTISIADNISPLMNTQYTIVEIETNDITLSYQGPFIDVTNIDLNIVSNDFISYPKFGLSTDNRKAKFVWSWKEDIKPDFFLYDFSGDQLKPYRTGFPNYNGPLPLCGQNGEINLRLLRKPNEVLEWVSDPQKQQTVFESIVNELEWTDETAVENILPNPLQVFVGFRSNYDLWNSTTLHLDFVEDISNTISTVKVSNVNDNVITFTNNVMEIVTSDSNFSFIKLGYRKGQLVKFNFDDVTGDDSKMTKFENVKEYVIVEVYDNKIEFEGTFITEKTVQMHPKHTYPQIDSFGNQIMIERLASVTITVLPKPLAYFNFSGESEGEDTRFKINLNNRNKDILQLNDFFIFKEVDINEEGIDWVFMNRKRKELLEIYGEIFNHISSYKAIIKAINFFGYNDLTFNEYFQNVDPENKKFGQIFNLELLKILDKATSGYAYDNLAFSQLRNKGYIKTNVFSLGYKATDEDGNFVNAYSLKEVEIKILGLKRWLNEHVVPLGAKIMDINAQYRMKQNFVLNHETYMNKNYRVEEYSTAVYFDINIVKNIISSSSNTYDVAVEFKTKDDVVDPGLFFSYEIKTFNIETWNNISYPPNSFVLYDGQYYTNGINQAINTDEPGISNLWYVSPISKIPYIQNFRDSSHELNIVSFTINELLDPYFEITVYWHSGYATTYSYKRSYNATLYNKPQQFIY